MAWLRGPQPLHLLPLAQCGGTSLAALQLSDHTGETWATAFAEQGMEIMGNKSGAHRHAWGWRV